MRYRRIALAILSVLLVASVAWAKKHVFDPFHVPRDQFRSSVKVIALRSAVVPEGVSHADEVRATFDSLITAGLTSAGYSVIPSKEFDALWKQGADSLGGLFDVTTGKPDTTKAQSLRKSVGHALKERFNADAVLHAKFYATTASFAGGRASWDGVSQTMTKGFMGMLAGSNASGHVPALSLAVLIDGDDSADLYRNYGGVQVMVKLGSTAKFVDVPVDSLFSNPERNARAVSEALEGLADEPEKKK